MARPAETTAQFPRATWALHARAPQRMMWAVPIHIAVAVKQVPDTSNVRINTDTGTLIREGVPAILNPYEAHALELAVRLKEAHGGTVTVLTMGPPGAVEALRECVEQGADRAILISDRKFAAADTLATSYVLARALQAIGQQTPLDLLLFGKQAIDGDTAQVGPGVATRLELPLISCAIAVDQLDLTSRSMIVRRRAERGIEVLRTALPAVLTVEKEIAAIRRAPLSNIVRAARYQPELWTASVPVAFDAAQIGIKGSPTIVGNAHTPALRAAGPRFNVAEHGLHHAVEQALAQAHTKVPGGLP